MLSGKANKWPVALLLFHVVTAAKGAPTTSNYNGDFVVCALSQSSNLHIPLVPQIRQTNEVLNLHLVSSGAQYRYNLASNIRIILAFIPGHIHVRSTDEMIRRAQPAEIVKDLMSYEMKNCIWCCCEEFDGVSFTQRCRGSVEPRQSEVPSILSVVAQGTYPWQSQLPSSLPTALSCWEASV